MSDELVIEVWAKIAGTVLGVFAIAWKIIRYLNPLSNRATIVRQQETILKLELLLEERIKEIDELNRVIRMSATRRSRNNGH
jgi:hypothetical protein